MDLLKLHWKLLYRNKLYRNTLIGLIFFILFISILFLKNGADFSYLFYLTVRFNFYFMLLFCTVSFLFFREDKSVNLCECIDVIDYRQDKFLKYNFVIMMLVMLVFNVFLLGLLFFVACWTNEVSLYYNCITSYYIMNVFLPQSISLIITAIISRLKNTSLSTGMFVLFILLSSPYIELLEWRTKPIIPIDYLINNIQKPFSYFYQNANWSIDPLYGYQNEMYKLITCVFWLTLFILRFIKNKILKKRFWLVSGCLVSLVIFSIIYLPESLCRVNTRWNGAYSDVNYYDVLNKKSIYKPEEKIEYNIEKYNLNIEIENQLYVDGYIVLQSSKAREDFVLTLYHNYKIEEIKSDNLLTYEQTGDYIYLKFNKPIDYEKLKIKYSGYHENLYSNYQAVQLPGYFPWYPMPGERQIYFAFDNTSIANYGYNPYNKVNANYEINIRAQYPLITNIQKIDNNKYKGNADSLTLIGGNLIEDNDKFKNHFPLYLSNDLTYNQYNQFRNESWNTLINKVKEIYSVDLNLSSKKIIVLSNSIGRISNIGNYAEFDDYIIIAGNGFLNDSDFLMYYILKNNDISLSYKDILILSGCMNKTQEELYQDIINELEDIDKEKLSDIVSKKGLNNFFKDLGNQLFRKE